ncbi:hypothetical protein CLV43_12099 [Umezawaea tangerina]|uniref:Uncharacterized protein n=1 Tax=Umezawaea tangerina TaxID=84725 RepID=A0A2T0SGY8_9PSEU|nr:hypothetical protein CLV43_12099 [Umezawaea tangerina]
MGSATGSAGGRGWTEMGLLDGTDAAVDELVCGDVEMLGTVGGGFGAASGDPQLVAMSSTTKPAPATAAVDQTAFFRNGTTSTIGADGRNQNP